MKPKPKLLLRPIKAKENTTRMNENSKWKRRENAGDHVAIGLTFASDWSGGWHKSCRPIIQQAKPNQMVSDELLSTSTENCFIPCDANFMVLCSDWVLLCLTSVINFKLFLLLVLWVPSFECTRFPAPFPPAVDPCFELSHPWNPQASVKRFPAMSQIF